MLLYALNNHINLEVFYLFWFRTYKFGFTPVSKKDFTSSHFDIDLTLCNV